MPQNCVFIFLKFCLQTIFVNLHRLKKIPKKKITHSYNFTFIRIK